MRAVSSATWTSGEPVSPLRALVIGDDLRLFCNRNGHVHSYVRSFRFGQEGDYSLKTLVFSSSFARSRSATRRRRLRRGCRDAVPATSATPSSDRAPSQAADQTGSTYVRRPRNRRRPCRKRRAGVAARCAARGRCRTSDGIGGGRQRVPRASSSMRLQRVERHRVVELEAAARRAAQRRRDARRSRAPRRILGEHAHVGALAAVDVERRVAAAATRTRSSAWIVTRAARAECRCPARAYS